LLLRRFELSYGSIPPLLPFVNHRKILGSSSQSPAYGIGVEFHRLSDFLITQPAMAQEKELCFLPLQLCKSIPDRRDPFFSKQLMKRVFGYVLRHLKMICDQRLVTAPALMGSQQVNRSSRRRTIEPATPLSSPRDYRSSPIEPEE
jgi:hypothetical protein